MEVVGVAHNYGLMGTCTRGYVQVEVGVAHVDTCGPVQSDIMQVACMHAQSQDIDFDGEGLRFHIDASCMCIASYVA